MFAFPSAEYQQQLIVASLDDFTPNAALPNYLGGQFGAQAEAWKCGVIDFLCINVKCGLIEATHRPEVADRRDVLALRKLLKDGDEKNHMPVDILWNALYFNGTVKLSALLDKEGMRTWEAVKLGPHPDLISKLVELYKNFALD
jgi:hypothetical protein